MVKIYTYGSREPSEGLDELWRQLRGSHGFYNKLVEIERTRRASYVAARTKFCPEVATLEVELARIEDLIEAEKKASKLERQRVGNRKAQSPRQAAIAALRKEKAPVNEALRAARERAKEHPKLQAASVAAEAVANAAVKKLRASTIVYWPTYNLCTESVQQAAKKSGAEGPRFKSWDPSGRVGGQFQGGIGVSKAYAGTDNRLRIVQLPDSQWDKRGGRRRAYTTVSLRINSDDNGGPIWCKLPIVMHRPLPPDGVIKYGWVLVQRIGRRMKYVVQLVVDSTAHARVRMGDGGALAVDVGWRTLPNGDVRVAYCIDEHGVEQEIRVPVSVVQRLAHAASVHSISDRLFDAAKVVAMGLKDAEGVPEFMPKWERPEGEEGEPRPPTPVAKVLAHLAQRRSHRKLASIVYRLGYVMLGDEYRKNLWQRWRAHRLSKGLDLLPTLEEAMAWSGLTGGKGIIWWLDLWRRKDEHLTSWEANEQRRALADRREMFRVAAARLAATYSSLVLEDLDLSTLVVVPEPQDHDDQLQENARSKHQKAAPGEMREALASAFGPARDSRHNPADTTCRCHSCKEICDWDQKRELRHVCEHCGAEWDQDANACRNLLTMEHDHPGGTRKPKVARKRVRRRKKATEEVKPQTSVSEAAE